jgi:hypothetical protein
MQFTPSDSYVVSETSPSGGRSDLQQPETQASEEQKSSDKPLIFEGNYAGQMEMSAPPEVVGDYLNCHQGWFPRCASPMQVSSISDHGYALVVGHFAVLGYEVEPKVGLYLSPLEQRTYRIDTISIPDYQPPGYEVDFQAVLDLLDCPAGGDRLTLGTLVDWKLSLNVKIHMPRFIGALPYGMVKSSGDRLLNQVVRQVSKRLTRKVQEDFHTTQQLPLPESYHRHHFWSNWGKGHSAG